MNEARSRWHNSPTGYGWVAIALHWGMALLLTGLFGVGVYMVDLTYYDPGYKLYPDLHRAFGVVAFALVLVRLAWRALDGAPDLEPGMAAWERAAAHGAHWAMYGLMLAIPVTGYLISTADGRGIDIFGWFELPAVLPASKGREETAGWIHRWLSYGMAGLVCAHTAAALKHHFLNRDRTLVRMLVGDSARRPS